MSRKRDALVRSVVMADGSVADVDVAVATEIEQVLRVSQAGGVPMVLEVGRDLTTSEAARIIGVSREWAARLADRGVLDARRVGTHRRIALASVLAYRSAARGSAARPQLEHLRRHRSEIESIVASAGGSKVRVFGSLARSQTTEGSDVDLLVEFGPRVTLMDLAGLEADLSAEVGSKVDVVPMAVAKRSPHLRQALVESVPL